MVAEKAHRRLTRGEEAFAQLVAKGMPYADAYREAYHSQSKNAKNNAQRVIHRPHVVARIKELSTPDDKRLFLTRARKREILREMVENKKNGILDRQRALVIDNRMTGDDRQIVSVEGEITLAAVLRDLSAAPVLPDLDELSQLRAPPRSGHSAPIDVSAISVETGPENPLPPDDVMPPGPAPGSPPKPDTRAGGGESSKRYVPGPFEQDEVELPVAPPPFKPTKRSYSA